MDNNPSRLAPDSRLQLDDNSDRLLECLCAGLKAAASSPRALSIVVTRIGPLLVRRSQSPSRSRCKKVATMVSRPCSVWTWSKKGSDSWWMSRRWSIHRRHVRSPDSWLDSTFQKKIRVATVHPKTLEQVAGFINHVGRAYPTLLLYLNGVYATINIWRPGGNEDGWKVTNDPASLRDNEAMENAPTPVKLVKRMIFDVQAMEDLTQSAEPLE